MRDLFGNKEEEPVVQGDLSFREYHTPTMRFHLAQLREAMHRARGTSKEAQATKDYFQLRDYMEKMSPEEWSAECRSRTRRRR